MHYHKYKDSYINFGFTWTGEKHSPKLQCLMCGVTLSNQLILPNKLKKHTELYHVYVVHKSADYFH
jgi:hypothetical protein